MSNELNSDAIISLTDDIVGEIAYAFAYKEDQCGFNGDGTSTYGGIVGVREKLGSAGTNQYDTGYAYNNIALQDITDTTALLPTYARMGARWFMSPTVYNQLEYLRVNAGGNTARDLEAGLNMRFLGYPVVLSEAMPSTATTNQICAIFGDLSLAADFGDRAGTSISVSDSAVVDDDSVFEKDELAVRGTMRFDINVHDAGDSSNAGPIVGLKTHSA
jgi:HK97 family phage major capsid protein